MARPAKCLACRKPMTPTVPRGSDRSRENNLCPECYAMTTTCQWGCGRTIPFYNSRGKAYHFFSSKCFGNLPESKEKRSKTATRVISKAWQNPEYRNNRIGKNHHRWKGGYSRVARGFTRYKRKLVKERDDFMCMNPNCPNRNTNRPLHVHHKDGNRNNNALANLITLCDRCHYSLHPSPLRKPLSIDMFTSSI